MIVNVLFRVNMKCLIFGEFCWVKIMIKIKIIVTLYFITNVMFWPFDPAKNAIQGDASERSNTF